MIPFVQDTIATKLKKKKNELKIHENVDTQSGKQTNI